MFLNEGQNCPFNKLLGAPAILLGAPSISHLETIVLLVLFGILAQASKKLGDSIYTPLLLMHSSL